MRGRLAWLLVVPVALWTAVRLLGLEGGYPLVPLMAFTPVAAVGAVLVTVAVAALGARVAALVAGVCAVALVGVVAPRALGGPSAAQGGGGPTIGVLSVNLRKGGADAEAIVALVRRTHADVLSLQEVSRASIDRLRAAGLERELPHAVVRKGDRLETDGTALFARAPLSARPVLAGAWNPQAVATARFGETTVEVTAVHPPAPVSDDRVAELDRELGRFPPATDDAVRLLVGDFNATLDHAPLRRLIGRGYEDAADQLGAGLKGTWPVGRRLSHLPVAIDHVLADARCGFRSLDVHTVPRTDHRALFARVVLPIWLIPNIPWS